MPYCGCQGSQAKKLWCLTSTFTTLCLACIIGYLVTASLCGQDIIDAGAVLHAQTPAQCLVAVAHMHSRGHVCARALPGLADSIVL